MTAATIAAAAPAASPTASPTASGTTLDTPASLTPFGAEASRSASPAVSFGEKMEIHCDNASIVERTMPRLETIGSVYGEALQEAHVHMNHGEGSDFEFPHGQTLVFDASATFCDASFLHENMFGQIAAALVLPTKGVVLSDDFFVRRLAALNAVPEQSEMPPRVAVVDKYSGADKKVWRAILGSHSFVGVYRCERRVNCPEFFIIAYVNSTPIGYDAWALAQERVRDKSTIGAYATCERMRYARRLAQRNVQRVIAETAEALGVRVRRGEDLSACPLYANGPLPLLAAPSYACEVNTVRFEPSDSAIANPGEGRVFVHDRAVDMTTSLNGVVFPVTPCDGLWVLRSSAPGVGTLVNEKSKATAHAVPLGLGMGPGAATPQRAVLPETDRFTWKGKNESAAPPSTLHSSSYRDFSKAKQTFLRELCGGGERLKLIPVIVRTSDS